MDDLLRHRSNHRPCAACAPTFRNMPSNMVFVLVIPYSHSKTVIARVLILIGFDRLPCVYLAVTFYGLT
ncbi:hypothetical protein KIN20_031299 [Parelaphostrongylus tenuis]|uniref:Uncharacterized protein n=1 Tax=Parelaphostrongylus tenuis TaxID=148309 RepID=A0AAD5R559_PARTN|nr:hypothetical protein KIN20_031299 [Parelaphostrongylus tenuis]